VSKFARYIYSRLFAARLLALRFLLQSLPPPPLPPRSLRESADAQRQDRQEDEEEKDDVPARRCAARVQRDLDVRSSGRSARYRPVSHRALQQGRVAAEATLASYRRAYVTIA